MKDYKVTMIEIVDGKQQYNSVYVTCEDAATDIWLNPKFKNIFEVEEL